MLNRIKAQMRVYGRHIEVMAIIGALLLGGGVTGYMIKANEARDIIARIQAAHVSEIERLQTTHKENVSEVASRIDEIAAKLDSIVDRQAMAVDEVGEAARTAKQAASTARGAATSAARAAIRETVTPIDPESVAPQPKDQPPPAWLLNGG